MIHSSARCLQEVARLMRHETCYRTVGSAPPFAMLGCGFMLKPGLQIDTLDSLAGHFSLVYVLRGTGRYRDAHGREWKLEPGMCFQRFPRHRHSLIIDRESNWAECFIALDPSTQEAISRFGTPDLRKPVLRPNLLAELVSRFDRFLAKLKLSEEQELPGMFAQALELMADIARLDAGHTKVDEDERLVEAARRVLGRNLGSRAPVTVLLRDIDAGHERLRKLFKVRTGMSPITYRLRCRVDAARSMLEDRSMPIKEVANALGYPTPYAFSAQFRKITGIPPTQFRQGGTGRKPQE